MPTPRHDETVRKIVKKKGKISKPQLDYLKSSEPLSEYHAEMVLMAAGIEYEGTVRDQVQKLVGV